ACQSVGVGCKIWGRSARRVVEFWVMSVKGSDYVKTASQYWTNARSVNALSHSNDDTCQCKAAKSASKLRVTCAASSEGGIPASDASRATASATNAGSFRFPR